MTKTVQSFCWKDPPSSSSPPASIHLKTKGERREFQSLSLLKTTTKQEASSSSVFLLMQNLFQSSFHHQGLIKTDISTFSTLVFFCCPAFERLFFCLMKNLHLFAKCKCEPKGLERSCCSVLMGIFLCPFSPTPLKLVLCVYANEEFNHFENQQMQNSFSKLDDRDGEQLLYSTCKKC